MNLSWKKHTLKFKFEAKTSRDALHEKDTWYLVDKDSKAIGECSPIRGLSIDNLDQFESVLDSVCNAKNDLNSIYSELIHTYPSIAFGIEMLLMDIQSNGKKIFYPSSFTSKQKGILINGLIWMGDFDFMLSQIESKLTSNFSCIKLKIGAIDFKSEMELIRYMRKKSPNLTIRLDANGAFTKEEAMEKLAILSAFNIHSIEQPIKQKNIIDMRSLIEKSHIPIALDEELIGQYKNKEILKEIKPDYIVLKPSLIGGLSATQDWIDFAKSLNIKWWITSALESNIALNAISQFTYLNSPDSDFAQGLGTGSLYHNNINSPLEIKGEYIYYDKTKNWDLTELLGSDL